MRQTKKKDTGSHQLLQGFILGMPRRQKKSCWTKVLNGRRKNNAAADPTTRRYNGSVEQNPPKAQGEEEIRR